MMETVWALKEASKWAWGKWKWAGKQLAAVLASVLFALLYIVVIGAYALGRKAARVFSPALAEATYWKVKPYREPTVANLEQPF